MLRDRVVESFVHHFGAAPFGVTHAPGRVNLIGEHTDYNDGFVLPMAIDREIYIAFAARADRQVIVHSIEYGETAQFDLDALEPGVPAWSEYIKGAAWAWGQAGAPVRGWQGVIAGNVPRGAGLSSSAALEMATLLVFAVVSEHAWRPTDAALLGRRIENE